MKCESCTGTNANEQGPRRAVPAARQRQSSDGDHCKSLEHVKDEAFVWCEHAQPGGGTDGGEQGKAAGCGDCGKQCAE